MNANLEDDDDDDDDDDEASALAFNLDGIDGIECSNGRE